MPKTHEVRPAFGISRGRIDPAPDAIVADAAPGADSSVLPFYLIGASRAAALQAEVKLAGRRWSTREQPFNVCPRAARDNRLRETSMSNEDLAGLRGA